MSNEKIESSMNKILSELRQMNAGFRDMKRYSLMSLENDTKKLELLKKIGDKLDRPDTR